MGKHVKSRGPVYFIQLKPKRFCECGTKKNQFRDTRYAYENMQKKLCFKQFLKLYENLTFKFKWSVNMRTVLGPTNIIIRLFKSEIKNLVLKRLEETFFVFSMLGDTLLLYVLSENRITKWNLRLFS